MDLDFPHRRQNLLTGEWVLVSPQRTQRPWLGQIEKPTQATLPEYDPECYLCPGNTRAGGVRNPQYQSTFVFDNDFAALLPPSGQHNMLPDGSPMLVAEPESGLCRVVCYSPRHDLSMPQLPRQEAINVVTTWKEQTRELRSLDFVSYVQVFENKGAMMGASNPHPHSQIWASSHIPNEPTKELTRLKQYNEEKKRCLLCDYLEVERGSGERVVASNGSFAALVPFWAIWPFELLIISTRHCGSLTDIDHKETRELADILQEVTARYDRLFQVPFPYSMGFHQAPAKGGPYPYQHLHAHYYPPLLRSATVRKFMVGYELLGMPQRDITPETAARRLREI